MINQINFKDMKKILFLLLSLVVLSSCESIREYNQEQKIKRQLKYDYSFALNFYNDRLHETIDVMSKSGSYAGYNQLFKAYQDSISKYEKLLNELN